MVGKGEILDLVSGRFFDTPIGEIYIPNSTPDSETFVQRFKAGEVYEGSPMPWNIFKRMSDSDLKAIYRYLQTVEPVENEIAEIARLRGE